MKKRTLTILIAVVLVVACAVGGTLAWLKTQTTPVVNTFTAGDINITLAETTTEYKMVPGNDIRKDPKVTVKAGSEDCWLFVKVDKSVASTEPEKKAFDDYLTYAIADGWKALTGVEGVYYREVSATIDNGIDEDGKTISVDAVFSVLNGDKVSVKDTVTKEMLNALNDNNCPTLTFTAYAIQKDNITTVADAWAKAQGLESSVE